MKFGKNNTLLPIIAIWLLVVLVVAVAATPTPSTCAPSSNKGSPYNSFFGVPGTKAKVTKHRQQQQQYHNDRQSRRRIGGNNNNNNSNSKKQNNKKISNTNPRNAKPSSSSPSLYQLRGGELYQPETLEEVNALVLNAASNGQLVVIDFTASWCGPCKMIAPLFKELSEEIEDVVFLKVDVDENPETAAKYSVSAMPTFIFVKAGEVVDRLMGANIQRLQEMIDEHM